MIAAVTTAMLSTTAMAEDWDNTSVVLTAKTQDYSISLEKPKSGADQLTVGRDLSVLGNLSATLKTNGDVQDYKVQLNKKHSTDLAYVGAKGAFNFGDSFNDDRIDLTPYVGVKYEVAGITPYAEVGYTWKTDTSDISNIDAKDTYTEVGASYSLNANTALKLSAKDSRDTDWNKTDRQLKVGITVSF